MSDPAISVTGLSKMYRLGTTIQRYQTMRDAVANMANVFRSRKRPQQDDDDSVIWALKDISFDVPQGDVVGLIGRNGAGKSTLLKILSRITNPTEGEAQVRGRVGSLLEVGTGFHQELSGRENVFLNAAILGMSQQETKRKFDEIVAFADVEKFVDTPVKRYSSGMYLRLAFAVAAHLETEILLVDEVLAVGDIEFQKKCLGKMGEVSKQGRTVLFVSHNLAAIESLCTHSVVIDQGQVDYIGETSRAIERYTRCLTETNSSDLLARHDRSGSGKLRFSSIKIHGGGGDDAVIATGETMVIEVALKAKDMESVPTGAIDFSLTVRNAHGQLITTFANFLTGQCHKPEFDGQWLRVQCVVPRLALLEGDYTVDLWLARGSELLDQIISAYLFHVNPGDFYNTEDGRKAVARKHGAVVLEHDWIQPREAGSRNNGSVVSYT